MPDVDKYAHLRKRYPNATPEELEEIDYTWKEYVRIALDVWKRLESDPEAYARMERLLEERKRKCGR